MKRRLIVLLIILFLTISQINLVSSEEMSSLVRDALAKNEGIQMSIPQIEYFFLVNNVEEKDKKNLILNQLKTDAKQIEKKIESMNTFLQSGNSVEVESKAQEIIDLSNKIYAHQCMFQLYYSIRYSSTLMTDLQFRGESTYDLSSITKKAELLIPQDFYIKLNQPYGHINYDSYEKYYRECTQTLQELNSIEKEVERQINAIPLGPLGLILTIVGIFITVILSFIFYKNKKSVKYIISIGFVSIVLYLSILFFQRYFIEARIIFGLIISAIILYTSNWLYEYYLKYVIGKKRGGTPLSKLKINRDYLDIFKDAQIESLEDLLKVKNLKQLSEDTGLSVETLIKLRKKANSL